MGLDAPPSSADFLDQSDDSAWTERLRQEMVGAGRQRRLTVGRGAVGGDDDDAGPGESRVQSNLAADVETSAAGHRDIEDREVRSVLDELAQRVVAVAGLDDQVGRLEDQTEQLAH